MKGFSILVVSVFVAATGCSGTPNVTGTWICTSPSTTSQTFKFEQGGKLDMTCALPGIPGATEEAIGHWRMVGSTLNMAWDRVMLENMPSSSQQYQGQLEAQELKRLGQGGEMPLYPTFKSGDEFTLPSGMNLFTFKRQSG